MQPSVRVRRRVVVSGRVQGVWFREGVRREAERLGVDGWVRNLPDHTVEAVFEGPLEAVGAAVTWCRTGPPRARVDRLRERDELPVGERGFVIR
jgi:acylphosphatase